MPKVLVLGDEPQIRSAAAEFLMGAGYDVVTASGLDSAEAIVKYTDIDVAVVDMSLPRQGGFELLKEVRECRPDVPIVVLAGKKNHSRAHDIVSAGVYDLLWNPVDKNVLIKTVSMAAEKKRLVRETRRLQEEAKKRAEHSEAVLENATLLPGADCGPSISEGTLIEITERKRAEESLRESQAQLASIIGSVMDAIITIDGDQRVVLFNRAAEKMFCCSAAEVIGKPIDQFIPERFRGAHKEHIRIFAQTNITKRSMGSLGSLYGLRAEGEEFPVEASISQVEVGAQKLYTVILRDITERKRAEEELLQMQQRLAHSEKIAALGRVAAQVAHEVKNPLAGLRLYSMHLRSKVAGKLGPDSTELVDKIVETIDRLSETVERVLNFARPLGLTCRAVDLNFIVADSIQVLESQIAANKVKKQLNLAESGTVAMLDEASIRSAVINLLLNAIQAMPDGGMLTVTTNRCGSVIHLIVSDTGCGMSEDELKKVFEPFHTTKSRGLGLGMPYARMVIEQHGGTILVESRPGEGTRVDVELTAEE